MGMHVGHGQVQHPHGLTPSTEAPPKVTTHAPAPPSDSVSSSGGTPSSQILYFAGTPILAAPGVEGMSSADLMTLVSSALTKQRQRQLEQGVQLSPNQILMATTSNATSTTTTVTQTKKGLVTTTSTANVKTYSMQNQTLGEIATAVTTDLHDELKKLQKGKNKLLNLGGAQSLVHQVLTSGVVLSIIPALDLVEASSAKGHQAAAAATAVSFAKVISRSGPAFQQLSEQLYPDDPKMAAQVTATTKQEFNSMALHQLGATLGLPGLSTQVQTHASVTRQQNKTMKDSSFQSKEVHKLTGVAVSEVPTANKKEVQANIQKVLAQVAKGNFNTRQELLTALQQAFKAAFPNNLELSNKLAAQVEADALDSALSSTGTVYAAQFNPSQINVNTLSDSIKNSILDQFAKSQEEVHAADIAAAATAAVQEAAVKGQLKSAQNVRDIIAVQLQGSGFTGAQAKQVAKTVDLGIPIPLPLIDTSIQAVLSPEDFKNSVHEALISKLGVSPDSALGQSVVGLVGLSDKPTGMIGLINQAYKADQVKSDNYLLLKPSKQVIKYLMDFLDPAKQIVLSFSAIINGTPDHENSKRAANSMV